MKVIYQLNELVGKGVGREPAFRAIEALKKSDYLYKAITLNTFFSGNSVYARQNTTYNSLGLNWRKHLKPIAGSRIGEKLRLEILIPSFDLLSSFLLIEKCDIFHGWNHHCLFSMRKAKKLGAQTLVERASSHILFQNRLLAEEYRMWGLPFKLTPIPSLIRQITELKEADYVLVPSQFAKDSFLKMGFDERRIFKIPFGTDVSNFPNRQEANDKFTVLYFGALTVRKGIQYLIKSWRELKLQDSLLLLVGGISAEVRPFLENLPANIKCTGFVPRKELLRIISTSSVYVFPSIEEGMAMSLTEAMSGGLPAIATENSGAIDILRDGTDGFILPIRNLKKLKEKIQYFHDNPEESIRMGRNARENISRFSWDKYADNLKNCYKEIAGC